MLSSLSAATFGNFTYTDNGTTISITGYVTWPTGAVVIPSTINSKPVTSIESQAFSGRSSMTSITIPTGVTSIGNAAFYGCSSLNSVTIPSSVTSIEGLAFYNCSGLTSITIPAWVTSIGHKAFYGCSGLTSIIIPASVTSIGSEAFYGCSSLTSVTIPSSVTRIESFAFALCSGLTSVTIPSSVSRIEGATFYNCSGLTSITIPSSVTSIGSEAFFNCSRLTSITIPDGVTSIGNYAFYYCSGLTSITIPAGVTSIGTFAFYNCSGLTSITIPAGVTSIGTFAFYNCSRLTSIAIPAGVTSIGDSTFYYCSGLTSITIPAGVTSIETFAFSGCSGLTSITIPANVTSIGTYAFNYCFGLTTAQFMGNAPSMGGSPFAGTASGFTVSYLDTKSGFTSPTWRGYTSKPVSSVSTLSGLILSSGTLSPGFATGTNTYTASVPNLASSIMVTPTVTDATATVKVNGVSVTSGFASGSISLAVGSNVITTVVTAEDGTTASTYTITVTRAPSAIATLSGLSLSSGALSPTFVSSTASYTAGVPIATTSITITPTVTDATATIAVNGTTVASGASSGAISLAPGTNTITTVVTAQDGVTQSTYAIIVTRGLVNAVFHSATTVPFSSAGYNATGNALNLSLGFAPAVGNNLTLVDNSGLGFITGQFSNLAQGQVVNLTYNGLIYKFVANYYGGTGNDLVLNWAYQNVVDWGGNDVGQLGNGSATSSSVPVVVTQTGVLAGKTVLSVVAADSHSLALCSDGTVAAWGDNSFGQLGNNSLTPSNVPVAVFNSGVLAGKTVVSVAATGNHSLALCSDGSVVAWGDNSSGQVGNNSTVDSKVPVLVTQSGVLADKTVVSVAAGLYHSLALCSDGTLVSWGWNSYGQLGNNTMLDSSLPVSVTQNGVLAGKAVVSISAGAGHSYALCEDGTIAAWGYNFYGQLGNSNTADSSVPVLVNRGGVLSGKTVVSVKAGGSHALALCSDGTLVAWGLNSDGQLGDNTAIDSSTPVLVTQSGVLAGKTVLAISAGQSLSLAMGSDGTVAAWGYGDLGQLGNGGTSSSSVPVLITQSGVLAGKKVVAVSAGNSNGVALAASQNPINLTNLTLSSGSLSPAFAPDTMAYTATVAMASVTITPTVPDATATVTVNGALVASGSASAAIPLSLGTNTITTVVTAQDGITTSIYTAVVTRISTVSSLSGLTINSGTLSPTFVSGTKVYTASVPNATTSMTVTPTVTDATATIKVNGTTVVSGASSGVIQLAVGTNTITTAVTAQDGTTTSTYTVTVTRVPSVIATLSGLNLSSGTLSPVFVSSTAFYTASVPNATTSMTVTPTVTDATATIKVNGTIVASGATSEAIQLAVGTNTITTAVTAQDGATTSTYTVTVTRVPSAIATLSDLILSSGTLSPAFVSSTASYTAIVPNATTSMTVTPTVTDATATIAVNGTTVASGASSGAISLAVGINTITTVVTAQDGTTTSTYTVTVTRAPSVVSTLSGLVLSSGTLSPGFATGTNTYSASVPNTASSITVTPTATDATAAIKVNGTTVVSGAAGGSISLAVGPNVITTVVTAQDGTTSSTYTVTVTRATSAIATLSGVSLSTGALSPAFVAATTSYTASVPLSTTSITVIPTATDATATIKVNGTTVASGAASGSLTLAVGANTITTVVTAQNKITSKTYRITVTRADNYDAWKAGVFPTDAQRNDPTISGDLATPANDGTSNLMKYALALNPMDSTTGNLPTTSREAGYLTLTYRRSKMASDVTYTVQAADSLTINAWTPAATILSQTDPTPGGGSHWLVTVRDNVPYASHPRRFMRLQVVK
jgi:alpha-tubulin suppressor-like RCC1 family protein